MQSPQSESMDRVYKEREQLFACFCLEAAALAPGAEEVTVVELPEQEEIPLADHDHD